MKPSQTAPKNPRRREGGDDFRLGSHLVNDRGPEPSEPQKACGFQQQNDDVTLTKW